MRARPVLVALAAVLIAAACRSDGRELREPTAPLPPTTTTTTTVPGDAATP